MNRSELYAHLAQNRRLLGMARDRFASLTDGLDHPGIDSAREELAAADAALSSAAGGISLWIRHCISLLAYGMSAWAVSAFTGRLLGLPAGWTIAVTVATLLALASPVSMLKDAIADRVNHRRTVAPASPPGTRDAGRPRSGRGTHHDAAERAGRADRRDAPSVRRTSIRLPG